MVDNAHVNKLDVLAPMTERQPGLARPARASRRGGWLPALLLSLIAGGSLVGLTSAPAAGFDFDLVRSKAVENANANCLRDVEAHVTVSTQGQNETMNITVSGVPPHTGFDVFVIQLPNSPFGLSWYQGDLQTNAFGRGHATFRGRFNIETFIVAQGSGPAPVVHDDPPFPDADTNPATEPVHTYHIGLWFDSPEAAVAAGCPATVTRFNGDHNAGIQALSTKQFADDQGPLRQVQ